MLIKIETSLDNGSVNDYINYVKQQITIIISGRRFSYYTDTKSKEIFKYLKRYKL